MTGKMFYKMGEVVEETGLEPHVLRFWESEFPSLKPKKNRSGHRLFARTDIDLILRIKRLLYEEGFTIAGAQKKLAEDGGRPEKKEGKKVRKHRLSGEIREIKRTLQNLINMLDRQ